MTTHLPFADELIGPVIRGEKTATVRLDGPDVDVGETVPVTDTTGASFGTVEITRTATTLAVEVHSLLSAFGANYPAETPQEVIDSVQQHDTDPIAPETIVDTYVFEYQE